MGEGGDTMKKIKEIKKRVHSHNKNNVNGCSKCLLKSKKKNKIISMLFGEGSH